MADCTVLAAKRDYAAATCAVDLESNADCYSEVEKKAFALLARLYDWQREWTGDKENFYLEIPAAGEDLPPFLTILEFSSDFTAIRLLTYLSALINVLRILNSLPLDGKDEYIAAERSAALDICRCVPYFLVRKSNLDLRTVHLAVATAWISLLHRETARSEHKMWRGFCKGIVGCLMDWRGRRTIVLSFSECVLEH